MKPISETKNFPLQWPAGVKRNKTRADSDFKASATDSWNLLIGELKRFGAERAVISTNVPLVKEGNRIMLDREPVDPGVAVYFIRDGKQMVFASDRWDVVRDNLRAIAKTIEALRGIERWGSSDMLERASVGFTALPASTKKPWRDVLSVTLSQPTTDHIQSRYRELARERHPDTAGGSKEAMQELNEARDEALREVNGGR